MKAAVLTVSDRVSAGVAEDGSGEVLEGLLRADGYEVVRRLVPDELVEIAEAITELAGVAELVLTTGGTGLALRDVTPEATGSVLERDAPGIPEALRAESLTKTPHAMLSRGLAGIVGGALVVQPRRLARRVPRRLRAHRPGAPSRAAADRGRRQRHRPHPHLMTMGRAALFARLVKIEHTVFALPFAYVGAFLAVRGVPSAHALIWITVAMGGARSLAMALNRLIDARIDAANPRTADERFPRARSASPRCSGSSPCRRPSSSSLSGSSRPSSATSGRSRSPLS